MRTDATCPEPEKSEIPCRRIPAACDWPRMHLYTIPTAIGGLIVWIMCLMLML